jgi:glycosyltransferase involved in cell wall biosynthesis
MSRLLEARDQQANRVQKGASTQAPVRVAFLTNEIPPYRIQFFEELAATPGWDFRLYTCVDREEGRLWDVKQEFSFPVKRSYSVSYMRRLRHTGPSAYDDFRQVHVPVGHFWDLLRFKPDVILSGEFGVRSLIGALYARLFRRRFILTFEGTSHTEHDISSRQRLVRRLIRRLPHAYVVNGSQSRRYVESLGVPSKSIFESGQPIDIATFVERISPATRSALRRELGIEGLCYLYCGRLIPLKGLNYLLDAWNSFSRRPGVRATLVLVGDGNERERLEQRIADEGMDNVRIVPHVQRDRLPAIYQSADVMVLPALIDCWALVVNEAMASGLPVINTKYSGSTDLTVKGGTGWVVDPLDQQQLAAALQSAWDAREQLPVMREAVRKTIATMSVPRVVDRIRRAIDHVRAMVLALTMSSAELASDCVPELVYLPW